MWLDGFDKFSLVNFGDVEEEELRRLWLEDGGGGVCSKRRLRFAVERVDLRGEEYGWYVSCFAPCNGVGGVWAAWRGGGVVAILVSVTLWIQAGLAKSAGHGRRLD